MNDGENKKYVKMGITGAAVLIAGIVCAFLLFNINVLLAGFQNVMNILKPFLYGAVIAYLLTPLCNKLEKRLHKMAAKKSERTKKALSFVSIILSLIFALLLVWMLFMLIIPQVWESIMKIVDMLPGEVETVSGWIDNLLKNQPELQIYFDTAWQQVDTSINSLLDSDILQNIPGLLGNISVQVIGVVNVFKNLFLGFLISAYLLASRRLFAAQAKLILHGVFADKWARIIEEEVRYIDKMFNGFFMGKIIDSAIIGVLCFIGTTLMGFEAAAFISVVIGVTNIIPFFGPLIGAVPCALLLLLENPMHCLYFLIFIIVLQQLDGNVIGPKILGNATGVSSFWVLFSILLFGGLWGIVGMVIGVPLFAVIYDIIRKLIYRGLKKHMHEKMIAQYQDEYHKKEEIKDQND
ncbi:MAG: AI-2E family transporter [Clostridium sp.]|nr:AI-2E family transporter [Clostridium sp.]